MWWNADKEKKKVLREHIGNFNIGWEVLLKKRLFSEATDKMYGCRIFSTWYELLNVSILPKDDFFWEQHMLNV